MRGCTAIGIDDDLAASQPGVAVRSADFKAASRVNVIDRVAKQDWRDYFGHDPLHIGVKLGFLVTFIIAGGMLGADHHGRRSDWQAAFITQRHLALGIRFQKRRCARMPISRHPLQDLVAVIERRRHQIGGFIGGIAKHDPLIACALVLVVAGINALRDVDGLGVKPVDEFELLPVEPVLLIADFAHRVANGRLDFFLRAGGPFTVLEHALAADLSGQHHKLSGGQGFAGDPRLWVL